MIRLTLVLIALLVFNACSLKTPENDWQRKSTSAFSSYTKNFLSGNDALAQNDLSRAIQHAKQSADLTQLAKIYLGECALNISSGTNDTCKKYIHISNLLEDKKLDAYYSLLTRSINKQQINLLPPQYQSFASNILKKDFTAANIAIQKMQKASSAFLCAALIKDKLDSNTRKHILDSASLNGYKKLVLFWLKEEKNFTTDESHLEKLQKKISILKSDI